MKNGIIFYALISLSSINPPQNYFNSKAVQSDVKINEMDGSYNFQNAGKYDLDLHKWAGPTIQANSLVKIVISSGTGRLVTYFGKIDNKIIFTIESCHRQASQYKIKVLNSQGSQITCFLQFEVKNNIRYIDSFWMVNPTTNTATVWF